jgi:hypothetical protein
MLRQFFLTLFLIALAMPAIAMRSPSADDASVATEDCHGMPVKHQDSDQQKGDVRLHGCIGCIAPFSAALAMAEEQPVRFIPFAEPIRRLTGTTPRPSLPPPRS